MQRLFKIQILFLLFAVTISAQGFKVKTTGVQTFNFEDPNGRNQATFYSAAPLEDINGTTNGISGKVSFDPANFAKTIKGKIIVKVASINTGIELRNNHMKSANWLNAEKYPDIVFEIISVTDVKQIDNNKLEFKAKGKFTFHGVTKEVVADAQANYLEENEQTKNRAPGDLLGVRAKFIVKLSEYGIENQLVGNKVAENIEVGVNIVGSNKL